MRVTSSNQKQRERIWYDDVRGFMRDDRLSRFLPEPGAPLAEQLNSIMRFSLYYALVLIIVKRSYAAAYVPIIAGLVTWMLYSSDIASRATRREHLAANGLAVDRRTGRPCTAPTRSNPFMNVLMSDYKTRPDRPQACDIRDSSVARSADALHSHNLYRDSDDVFGRRTSSRPFYTTPGTTIPNDQAGFASWLYGNDRPTCKEGNGDMCYVHLSKLLPGV